MNPKYVHPGFPAGVLLASLLACVPPSEEETVHASSEEATAPSNKIAIPPTVRSNLGITFAAVEARRVAQTLRVPGSFELQPLARHEYRMALPGRVELLVDQYERIEPGQPLFRFQSPEWPELLHEIILGEQGIEMALAEIDVGKAKVAEAREKLELARERIAALAQADFKKADLEAQATELAASLPRLVGDGGGRLVLASRCLIAGGLLLPLGFFLGGVFVHEGDPGLAIVLAPVGALLLLVAVGLIAIATRGPSATGSAD